MSSSSEAWVPLSVRRGIREPFRLVEGIPEHARPGIDAWVGTLFDRIYVDEEEILRFVVSSLRLPFHAERWYQLTSGLQDNDDRYLDVLDLLSAMYPGHARRLESDLSTAGSAWRADVTRGGLQRRVPEEAKAAYERALKTQPTAAEHLSGAWEHAFGRHPDAGDAWGDAIRALEAVLSPIVIPRARLAKLSDIQSAVRNAPEGKFIIRAAGRDPKASLSGMLESIPYEPGRHGSDHTTAELQTARIVVLQATAILAAISEGLIERADAGNDEEES